ncbi:hypothetical protein EVAR_43890_1 [Eumeta japonica]|uniref:Uncharacterized protein n=1 Tax=Eumeta variegata TaxID=151549 RepID=A0A4C1WQS7_EUMVA|nr:hypothetical protein EVAR_43890_1 [Eumeta japonica]
MRTRDIHRRLGVSRALRARSGTAAAASGSRRCWRIVCVVVRLRFATEWSERFRTTIRTFIDGTPRPSPPNAHERETNKGPVERRYVDNSKYEKSTDGWRTLNEFKVRRSDLRKANSYKKNRKALIQPNSELRHVNALGAYSKHFSVYLASPVEVLVSESKPTPGSDMIHTLEFPTAMADRLLRREKIIGLSFSTTTYFKAGLQCDVQHAFTLRPSYTICNYMRWCCAVQVVR